MNNMKEVAEQYKGQYPAFPTYLECQSRAFMVGLSSFTLGFAAVYFLQELNRKRLPAFYQRKHFLLPAALVASIVSWNVTRRRTLNCQRMWMAAEGRHTALSHYDDAVPVKPVVQPGEATAPLQRAV
ncbi:uncharacterized protein LOC129589093 [Paramacrobiotus metropolitanus]|uniref:uncharacterized protein LOC129589093 n=1 Tax=Paramacrobiotus metropolitanus TaxID=2943436 RepID=UPI0024459697|nr:uncharacterized protein LOC129589093 [Paramacrobiotus metropolitanus]